MALVLHLVDPEMVPNRVHILCTRLGTWYVHLIGYTICTPEWVHNMCLCYIEFCFWTLINSVIENVWTWIVARNVILSVCHSEHKTVCTVSQQWDNKLGSEFYLVNILLTLLYGGGLSVNLSFWSLEPSRATFYPLFNKMCQSHLLSKFTHFLLNC